MNFSGSEAQDFGDRTLVLGGGFSIPIESDFSDQWTVGYDLSTGIEIPLKSYLKAGVSIGRYRFGRSDFFLTHLMYSHKGGEFDFYNISLDFRANIPEDMAFMRMYLVFGSGLLFTRINKMEIRNLSGSIEIPGESDFGSSFYIGPGLQKNINRKIMFFVELRFLFSVGLDDQYRFMPFNAGLRFSIGR